MSTVPAFHYRIIATEGIANAVRRGEDSDKARVGPNDSIGQAGLVLVVELRRFELLTSSMRTKRATNCAIAP